MFWTCPRAIAVLCCSALAPVALAQTYSDGDFDPLDWQSAFSANYGNGGSFTAAQAAGGNPGTKYRVHHDLNNAPSGEDSGLAVAHVSSLTHDPATDGPINAINAAMHVDKIDQSQRVRIVIIQDATTYVSQDSFTVGSLPLSGWNVATLPGLDEQNFAERFADLTVDTGSNPDFSATGSPMTFGFETSNSTGVGFGGYTTTADFDNFTITIVAPPSCPGDLDGDTDTDVLDFALFVGAFGSSLGDPEFLPEADLDGSDSIDVLDFSLFVADFGCPN